jgi:hypothetical protein
MLGVSVKKACKNAALFINIQRRTDTNCWWLWLCLCLEELPQLGPGATATNPPLETPLCKSIAAMCVS